MQSKKNPMEKKERKRSPESPHNPPKAGQRTPDANVADDGHCIVPAHPESTRLDTGEPCDDGRADDRR
ncbi:hypothetical protein LJC26_04330 [Desulfovibrio sp. OttesenSCG-928-O18]|nr:hypothetical protein [Desulfovibrio sp. OttesenSCG-928-O18]